MIFIFIFSILLAMIRGVAASSTDFVAMQMQPNLHDLELVVLSTGVNAPDVSNLVYYQVAFLFFFAVWAVYETLGVYAETMKKMHRSASCIQAQMRGFLARKHFQESVIAAMTIQMYWQAYLMWKNRFATLMQAMVRGFLARKRLENAANAVINIQCTFRGFIARVHFAEMISAIKIQSKIRGFLVRLKLEKAKAVVLIQKVARGFLASVEVALIVVEKKNHSATTIQAAVRGFIASKNFALVKDVVLLIQKMLARHPDSAPVIQAVVGGFIGSKNIKIVREAVLLLQKMQAHHPDAPASLCQLLRENIECPKKAKLYLRHHLLAVRCSFELADERRQKEKAVIPIQAAVRTLLARAEFHRRLEEKERIEKERIQATVRLQAFMRGSLVRAALASITVEQQAGFDSWFQICYHAFIRAADQAVGLLNWIQSGCNAICQMVATALWFLGCCLTFIQAADQAVGLSNWIQRGCNAICQVVMVTIASWFLSGFVSSPRRERTHETKICHQGRVSKMPVVLAGIYQPAFFQTAKGSSCDHKKHATLFESSGPSHLLPLFWLASFFE